jgi:riboflavin synthase
MFTGIVEEMGEVVATTARDATRRLEIRARVTVDGTGLGASLAVNGTCLTVVGQDGDRLAFDVGPETLVRTTLGRLAPGDRVNLERPLKFGAALGGHLVLGHVDAVATVDAVTRVESTARVRIRLPGHELEPLLVEKGSVAVDGVSLTVAALGPLSFEVMVIPHTLEVTTLGSLVPGQAVNLETDVIGKYLVRSLALRGVA